MSIPDHDSSTGGAQEYEFSGEQNQVIGRLAAAMNWVAIPFIVLGIIYAIAAVAGIIHAFTRPGEATVSVLYVLLAGAVALFFIGLGSMTQKAAGAFQQVVDTKGQDIRHLMEALSRLLAKYSALATLVKVYIAFTAIALVMGLIGALIGAFKG